MIVAVQVFCIMDWTSVYDETGEEDLILPHLMERTTQPRLSRLVSKVYHAKHHFDAYSDSDEEDAALMVHHRLWDLSEEPTYTLKELYYFSINYILGVGVLGIPYAFARAGFILCSSILVVVSLLSYMTVMWVAETGVRFEKSSQTKEGKSVPMEKETTVEVATEKSSLIHRDSLKSRSSLDDIDRYEVVDLVAYYLGPLHQILYQVSLISLMYVGLLAYTQVFCGAITELVWGSNDKSKRTMGIPQLIFGVMVVPLSCMELDEQVTVQSIMAVVRFVAIFVMVAGCVLALSIDHGNNAGRNHPLYFASPELDGCQMSYTACFSGFGVAFSAALFSQLFQHSVPGLLRPLKEKTHMIPKVPLVFCASLVTTCSFYLLIGTAAAAYFGADTRSSVNLNFADFFFGLDPNTTPRIILAFLRMASDIVVMFPALDTVSVFPLIANTLGNNLFAASSPTFVRWIARHLPSYRQALTFMAPVVQNSQTTTARPRYSVLSVEEKKALTLEASKIATIFWRIVAAIPPLVASLWATDLSFSFLLAGVAGLYVAFFAPSLLHLASHRFAQERTIYNGWYSRSCFAYPVMVFATFSLGVVLFQIRDAWAVMNNS